MAANWLFAASGAFLTGDVGREGLLRCSMVSPGAGREDLGPHRETVPVSVIYLLIGRCGCSRRWGTGSPVRVGVSLAAGSIPSGPAGPELPGSSSDRGFCVNYFYLFRITFVQVLTCMDDVRMSHTRPVPAGPPAMHRPAVILSLSPAPTGNEAAGADAVPLVEIPGTGMIG